MKAWATVARTVVAGASAVDMGILGTSAPVARHATDGSGALIFSLEEVAPDCFHLVVPGSRGPLVHAVASDVSSVPHRGRVRGRVELTGYAHVMTEPVCDELLDHLGLAPGQPVARLVPDTVVLEWTVERGVSPVQPVEVDAGDYAAADLDALTGWQDGWIAHLDAHHREDLRQLVAQEIQPVGEVRPVLADVEGLVLREYVGTCQRDIRVAFPVPAQCGCEAIAALKDLFAVNADG